MNTYMILFNYTEQGIRTVKDGGNRLDGLKRRLRELGGAVEAFYLTLGPYDTVAVGDHWAVATSPRLLANHAAERPGHGGLPSRHQS
jgi:uncharacterized protein with GYD domain